jgi:hypothetical protein
MSIHNTHPDDASPLLDPLDGPMIHSGAYEAAANTTRLCPGRGSIALAVAAEFGASIATAEQWMRDIDWRAQ